MICTYQVEDFRSCERHKKVISQILIPAGQYLSLDYGLAHDEKEKCRHCGGAGEIVDSDCPECDGEGELEFETDFHDYTATCKSCQGSGLGQEQGSCENCNATGKAFPDGSHLRIDGIDIKTEYYELLKKVALDIEVAGDPETNWLKFRNKHCQGVINGMRI